MSFDHSELFCPIHLRLYFFRKHFIFLQLIWLHHPAILSMCLCVITQKSVIKEINAEGIDAETDVVKVVRKGYKPANATQSERLGTVLVELRSTEVKTKIMKAKSKLATHERLKNVRISNMKTQAEGEAAIPSVIHHYLLLLPFQT